MKTVLPGADRNIWDMAMISTTLIPAFLRAVDNVLPNWNRWPKNYAKEDRRWRLAAISYKESHWDPLATSPTGVRGLMMMATKIPPKSGFGKAYRCGQNISSGARYLEYDG